MKTKAKASPSQASSATATPGEASPFAGHTPGPWALIREPAEDDGPYCYYYLNSPPTDYDGGFLAADARLIAAAPALLAALKALLGPLESALDPHGLVVAARAAIAKAEGKS